MRTARPLLLIAVLAIAASCAGPATDDGATANGGPGAARAQAVAFAECMRGNGVAGFPDPDPSGELTIDAVANGSAVDPDSAAFEQALAACDDLVPAGFTGPEELTPQQLDARLEFAACMRENGVPDFPDPAPDAPLVDTNRIPSSATAEGMTILDATMQACGDVGEAARGVG